MRERAGRERHCLERAAGSAAGVVLFLAAVSAMCAHGAYGAGAGVEAVEAGCSEEWTLVFSDDFKREELGDDWRVLAGDWKIDGGRLFGRGQIMVDRKFSGLHRVVFEGMSEDPCDLSPFIHASESGFVSGYFLQFGGMNNMYNAFRRMRAELAADYRHIIIPGEVHRIQAEFDGENVRLTVDGNRVHDYKEDSPLIGKQHQRAGIYIHNPSYVYNFKVYVRAGGD